jgi:hypothetical protein
MIKKLLKSFLTVMLSAFFLVVVAVVIRLFIKNPQTSLQDILFYVGAAPIAFFSIGFFGDRFGKGSISYQLSRSVSQQTPNKRAQKDEEDNRERFLFSIHWIFAGLLVWLFSYFL